MVGGTLLLIGGLSFFGARPRSPLADVTTACVQHTGVGLHIHPHLTITIDGAERKIPKDIGVTSACMKPLHTHDDTGTIHVELPVEQEVRLGEFFAIWQQPLSRTRVLDREVSAGDTLHVTVNEKDVGSDRTDVGAVPLRDGDRIAIEVRRP